MIKSFLKFFTLFLFIIYLPLNVISLDDSDIFLDSVFLSAVKKSDYDKVMNMLEEGLSSNVKKISINELDSKKMVPLAYALKNDDLKMFKLLLKNGADPNVMILNKASLLTYYVTNKKSRLIIEIIDSGCNINSQDRLGRTALMMAVESMNFEAVKTLSKIKIDVELTDFSGKTILDYAKKARDKRILDLINKLVNP
ncbi:MAG: hypothetical protein CMM99_04395 [Rickettsiales bacterium]|nr:hypothetical protein [Rickettsiales bacterium]|tara:strand:+ start:887 stop:1477 length:591 start_codon:yes stop_codon:yes gene_type:complete